MILRAAMLLVARLGYRRLRAGYCPACYSSPPDPDCSVCEGSHQYGDAMTADVRGLWWSRWTAFAATIIR